jgi:hypothetical protein
MVRWTVFVSAIFVLILSAFAGLSVITASLGAGP